MLPPQPPAATATNFPQKTKLNQKPKEKATTKQTNNPTHKPVGTSI